jgi:hypothetical protein
MVAREKTANPARYDVFNGDADGICSLHQLRLAEPAPDAILVTGVKRDIALLERISDAQNSLVTVLDISMHVNSASLHELLSRNNEVVYVDHHFAGDIPESPLLQAHIEPQADRCTALIVDALLGGKYRLWAICAAFGDNLHPVATSAASELSLSEEKTIKLREIGELLNYNGYGAQLEDLYFSPDYLYKAIKKYRDPFDFSEESHTLKTLKTGYENDMSLALAQSVFASTGDNRVYRFPDSPWSRRVSGVFANLKARENPAGAHAMITENSDGTLRISVRAPITAKHSADTLCLSFPSGGGRAAAAGINALPEDMLGDFIDRFNATYG